MSDKPEAENHISTQSIEADEEAKLKAKYPNLNMGRKGIGSSVLQKRINRGQKYFDSGDYNMARAKAPAQVANVSLASNSGVKKVSNINAERMQLLQESTGDTIATPENVPAVRKRSMAPTALSESRVVHHPVTNRFIEQKQME